MVKKVKRKVVKKVKKVKKLELRQENFLARYLDPKSKTYSNALQSALKAGYSREYSENIMSLLPDWISDNIGKLQLLAKAEKNLELVLDIDYIEPVITAFGPVVNKKTKQVYTKVNTNILRTKADISKFVAETIGKKSYSKRHEHTGDEGGEIVFRFKKDSDD